VANLYALSPGPIPDAIMSLVHLTVLRMPCNQLTGAIPEAIGKLRVLEELELFGNKLEGAGANKALRLVFDLPRLCVIAGVIPKQIGYCKALKVLRLQMNQLQGPIPRTIGACANLEILSLSANPLEGEAFWFCNRSHVRDLAFCNCRQEGPHRSRVYSINDPRHHWCVAAFEAPAFGRNQRFR
jgi:hypothetical protein